SRANGGRQRTSAVLNAAPRPTAVAVRVSSTPPARETPWGPNRPTTRWGRARYASSPERCLLARADIALDKQHPCRSEAPFVLLTPLVNQAGESPGLSSRHGFQPQATR